MGQTFSRTQKIQTPYEILGVNELSKLSDIKKAYRKLYYQNQRDPIMMEKINSAMNSIEKDFDLALYLELYEKVYYTEFVGEKSIKPVFSKDKANTNENNYRAQERLKVFKKDDTIIVNYKETSFEFDFIEISQDMFNKMEKAFAMRLSLSFNGPELNKFYSAWNRCIFDDKEFEHKIRKLIKIVKENDPRIKCQNKPNLDNSKELNKNSKQEQNKIKEQKQFKVQCTACNKGFNNKNTLKDHLNSRKHISLCNTTDCLIYNVPIEVFEKETQVDSIEE